jgi:hypothetical protein
VQAAIGATADCVGIIIDSERVRAECQSPSRGTPVTLAIVTGVDRESEEHPLLGRDRNIIRVLDLPALGEVLQVLVERGPRPPETVIAPS